MIPILFSETETAFTSMGIGALSDATKVTVRRVLNGKDELEISYPVGGSYYNEIKNSRQILAQPEYKKPVQAYRIYQVTKPMNGFITVNARHISERRMFTMVEPFTASSVAQAMSRLGTKIVGTNPFTFYTDKSTVANYKRTVPSSLGSVLGGSEGSLLDVYGGEYEFDMYQIKLLNRRGIDRGINIEYGKNLQKLEVLEAVDDSVITSVCPIWTGEEDGEQVYLPEYILNSASVSNYPYARTIVVDFSDQFESAPTVAQLRSAGQQYLNQSGIGEPKLSLKVTFVHLAEFPEYQQYAVLETLNLGDSVNIHHVDLGVDVSARIIELAYDVLNERYVNITVGRIRSNMSSTLQGLTQETDKKIKETKTKMQEAIEHATDLLTGVEGGYFVISTDADGHPTEALFMDTDDTATATNVLRINRNGIGFSTSGINGPYTSAWTIDGNFVADFITAGTLNANLIKAGVLEDNAGKFSLNLATGAISADSLSITSTNFQLTSTGEITSTLGTIGRYEITSTYLRTFGTAGDNSTCVGMGGNQAFWAGAVSSASAPFRVSYSGDLVATSADITGKFTMTDGTVNIVTSGNDTNSIKLRGDDVQVSIGTGGISIGKPVDNPPFDSVVQISSIVGTGTPIEGRIVLHNNTSNYSSFFYPDYISILNNPGGTSTKYADFGYNGSVRVRLEDSPSISTLSPSSLNMSNGTQSISLSAGGSMSMYNGTNKYSALVWPDSNGAGRLILGDGSTTKWRTELTNSGLVFRDSSDVVTGNYPAEGLSVATLNGGTSEGVSASGTAKSYTLDSTGVYLLTVSRSGSVYTSYDGVWLVSRFNTSHITPIVVGSDAPTPSVSGTTLSLTTTSVNQRITIAKLS